MKKPPAKPFTHGDLVRHAHRGVGVFENYAERGESCFVRFFDSGSSDKVTASLVTKTCIDDDEGRGTDWLEDMLISAEIVDIKPAVK